MALHEEEVGNSAVCRECGICCFALEDYGYHAEVEEEEWSLLPKYYRNLAKKVEKEFGSLALPTRDHYNGPGACVAFKGRLFGRCSCKIYKERPKVCRSLIPNGKECRRIRQEYFYQQEVMVAYKPPVVKANYREQAFRRYALPKK